MQAFIIISRKNITAVALTALIALSISACGVDGTETDNYMSNQEAALTIPASDTSNRLELNARIPVVTEADVCCALGGDIDVMPGNQCAGQTLPMDRCNVVCCAYNGRADYVIGNICANGIEQPMDACHEPKSSVCCYANGSFSVTDERNCRQSDVTAFDRCTMPANNIPNAFDKAPQHVCCANDNGFEVVRDIDCRADKIVEMEACLPPNEPVCCNIDGDFTWMRPDACRPQSQVSEAACETALSATNDEALTCCLIDDDFAMVPAATCSRSNVASKNNCASDKNADHIEVETIEIIQPKEPVCCDRDNGEFEMVSASQCNVERVADLSSCGIAPINTSVCCNLMGHFQWMTSGSCQDGDISEAHMCNDNNNPFGF